MIKTCLKKNSSIDISQLLNILEDSSNANFITEILQDLKKIASFDSLDGSALGPYSTTFHPFHGFCHIIKISSLEGLEYLNLNVSTNVYVYGTEKKARFGPEGI